MELEKKQQELDEINKKRFELIQEIEKIKSKSIGGMIIQARKDRGMRQEDLAKAIGVHAALVSKWERNKGSVQVSSLERIAQALNAKLIIKFQFLNEGD